MRLSSIRLVVEDPDSQGEDHGGDEENIIALRLFAQIWGTLAPIDPFVDPIDPEEFDGEYGITVINFGDKWSGWTKDDAAMATDLALVADDVLNYVNRKLGTKLGSGWDYNRGSGSYVIGVEDFEDMGAPSDLDEFEDDEFEDDEFEGEDGNDLFMKGIHESTINYETLVDHLRSVGENAAKNYISVGPFARRVIENLYPGFDLRRGRYGFKVTKNLPPWYSRGSGLHKIAAKQGGEPITIQLHDAEREFPYELYQLLSVSSHKFGGHPIGWASGFAFPDRGILSLIEIQSDVVRRAPVMLQKADHIEKYLAQMREAHPKLAQFSDTQIMDIDASLRRSPTSNFSPFIDIDPQNLKPVHELRNFIHDNQQKFKASSFAHLRERVIESFDNWQDEFLATIVDYARERGFSKVKLPTASRLGKFWRAGGENPNMKVLKAIYDKKLRLIGRRIGDWWIINI